VLVFPVWCSVLSRPSFWLWFSLRFSNRILKRLHAPPSVSAAPAIWFICKIKEEQLTGGLPPFHPLCHPSKGHRVQEPSLCPNRSRPAPQQQLGTKQPRLGTSQPQFGGGCRLSTTSSSESHCCFQPLQRVRLAPHQQTSEQRSQVTG